MPPAGYKRSRALWDEARRPGANISTKVHAVLYELQPIRFSEANKRQLIGLIYSLLGFAKSLVVNFPAACRIIVSFLRTRPRQQWLVVAAIVAYYYVVRWMHEMLDAGPIVVILTSLVAILTVGLGDNANPDGLSAYSAFNRGFERIMGSVDVDSLLQQHVGGGLGGGGGPMGFRAQPDEPPVRVARRPARNEENERNNQEVAQDDSDDDEEDQPPADNNNRARKSGKKARRRNLEQRQDIRRQREAAAALGGMQGGEGPEDMVAVQRMIEEQIAAENQVVNQ